MAASVPVRIPNRLTADKALEVPADNILVTAIPFLAWNVQPPPPPPGGIVAPLPPRTLPQWAAFDAFFSPCSFDSANNPAQWATIHCLIFALLPRLPPTMGTLDCRADRATVLGCPFVLPRHADLLQRAAVVDGYRQWLDALLWAGEAAALPVAGTATLLPSLATQFAARLSLRLAPAWDSRDAAFLHSDQDVATAVFRLVRHLDEVGDVRLLCWCQDVSDASPLRCHCCELAATALQLLSVVVGCRLSATDTPN